ncbi:MAG: PAS domain S-box protein [Eubacteriales bacterium]
MEEKIYDEVMQHAPFGYAYHKVLFDVQGKAVDYIILDMNLAFEKMTGINRQDGLHKKITEVLPDILEDPFDWINFYGNIAFTGESRDFTQYSESLDQWYKVNAFSPEKGYFITFIQNVTPEMKQIENLEIKKLNFVKLNYDLEIIFNSTQDAMFLIKVDNEEFHYIRNNSTHQKLTGLDKLNGKTPVELVGKEMGETIESNYRKCVKAGETITYEEFLQLPGGKRIWLTNLNPVYEHGEISYIVGSSKDITLQKKSEEERNDLLQRFQSMFIEHGAIMLIIDPVIGTIVDANPAALSFYGYTKDEILKLTIQDINMLPKEEVAKRRNMVLMSNQKYFLFPHRLKDGEIRFVDVYSSAIHMNGKRVLYSIIFDVSDRKKYKEELYHEKELLRTTLLSIGDGVVTTDEFGKITSMNKVAEEITGWTEIEAIHQSFSHIFKLISEVTGKVVQDPISKVLRTGRIIGLANHTALINKEGVQVPVADSAAPIKNEEDEIYGAVMIFRDVTKEKEQIEKIMFLSYRDALTGLYNRRFMEEELKRLELSRELPYAVILGDLNGLKLVNDVFGHEEGDNLLKCTADIIRDSCRQEDIIARWGGDEFLILLPRTNAETAETVIERIKTNCLKHETNKARVSISLGHAVKKQSSESFRFVIKEAEEYMYRRKLLEGKSYRNAIVNTMITTLYARSTETEEHANRLQGYCFEIGKQLELSSRELDEMMLLAVLHDIGKVAIDEKILKKPGPLTSKEWKSMKKHPEIGYRIAQNTPELASVAEYILLHHERWDGKGYPRGLEGKEIPIHCRILAVIDAYDAMTNDRCYRKAMGKKDAMEELKRNNGKQFDEHIVNIFLKYIEKDQ